MKRNSTRILWLKNKEWYKIIDGNFEIEKTAPPEAWRSFAEWSCSEKMTFRKIFRIIRSKFF